MNDAYPVHSSHCIFSGELLDRLIDSCFVSDVPGASTFTPREFAARVHATIARITRFFSAPHNLLVLISAPFERETLENTDAWIQSVVSELTAYGKTLDDSAAVYYGDLPTISTPLNTAYPTWGAFLDTLELRAAEPGLSMYSRSNCHYIVLGGFVLQTTGYHGFNLYNRFARTPINWH